MITVFGISNCDKVKQARRWLEEHAVDYRFHDFRRAGVERARLLSWCEALGWERLLNRRGTTWRALAPAEREPVDADKALSLMCAHPALIKRPVVEAGSEVLLGFEAETYRRRLLP